MGLATITFQGRGRTLGAALGQRFRESISRGLACRDALIGPLRAAGDVGGDRATFDRQLALHRDRFAPYLSELEGLAEGAGLAFETLFMLNLGLAAGGDAAAPGAPGGTTCSVLGPGHALIGHNVDGFAGEHEHCYFVRVEPGDAAPFTALCRPGQLPGNAFGFNDHGLCIVSGELQPRLAAEGAARAFLCRSVLAQPTIDDAIGCLRAQPRGEGFTCTLGARGERRIVNVEVAADAVHTREVTAAQLHANHSVRQPAAQQVAACSRARQQRGEALLARRAPVSGRDVLAVLRDQGDREWPIWRDGTAPDRLTTLFSALFDLERGALRIYPGPTRHAADPNLPLAAAPIPGR